MTAINTSLPNWSQRFFFFKNLPVGIELAAVFYEEKAESINEQIKLNPGFWDEGFVHYVPAEGERNAVIKLYFRGVQIWSGSEIIFDFSSVAKTGLIPDHFEWNAMRMDGYRFVCAPRPIPRIYLEGSELTEEEILKAETEFWGGDRPDYYHPRRKKHQLLTGNLVDYNPAMAPENRRDWIWRPWDIKFRSDDGYEFIVGLTPEWHPNGVEEVVMVADKYGLDEDSRYLYQDGAFKELMDYKFGPSSEERKTVRQEKQQAGLDAIAAGAMRRKQRRPN